MMGINIPTRISTTKAKLKLKFVDLKNCVV